MEYRWEYKITPSEQQIQELCNAINISPIVATLLLQRNIYTFEQAKQFFRPSPEHFHDPYTMKDMEKAVRRINQAFANKEKILIYGDYDVDGTCSVAMVYSYLRKHYPHLYYYLPDRYKEGYGISYEGIDYTYDIGCSLIIALDCGIKSPEKIEYASRKNIDFIICDHHLPGEVAPKAVAVLDPKQKECTYSFKELCGCGVGFKLLHALALANGYSIEELYSYLDLVAVATCSDIVPIIGENRTFVALGMKKIYNQARPGLKTLAEIAGKPKINEVSDIVFLLGPRINAAGRMQHAKTAVELLLAETYDEAIKIAHKLNNKNLERKTIDTSMTSEALSMIETAPDLKNAKATVLYNEHWHKGIIGIVASRCIEKYHRPTIIFTRSGEYITGSARSVPGFDIHAAIEKCAEYLIHFGGHMHAAGLTLHPEKIEDFKKKFNHVVENTIEEHMLVPTIHIDMRIHFDHVTPKLYNLIKQMAPFGPGNMQPVFVAENVQDTGYSRLLKNAHLKLHLKQEGSKQLIEAIAFNMPEHFKRIKKNEKFNLCFSIDENEFNGKKTIQLYVRDIKFDTTE